MITYFVHSQSLDNEKGVRSGWQNPSLSIQGEDQACQLRDLVAAKDFDFIFASDLLRAKQTAWIVFPDQEIQFDQRLREMNYGDLNGSHRDAFPADEMWYIENRFENGESCLDVQARILDFVQSSIPSGAKTPHN